MPMLKIFVLVTALGFALTSHCVADENLEPKWLQISFGYTNLDQVTKIEVQEDVLTFIGRDKAVIAKLTGTKKEWLARLRALMRQSLNWVEASKARDENQEWYVNLANVPMVGSFNFVDNNTKCANFFWSLGDLIGVSSSDDATVKARTYFSHRGFKLD